VIPLTSFNPDSSFYLVSHIGPRYYCIYFFTVCPWPDSYYLTKLEPIVNSVGAHPSQWDFIHWCMVHNSYRMDVT
jgi:hypothetical protein